MRAYAIVLHEDAWSALSSAGRPAQRRLLHLFDAVRANPFRPGDFREQGADGRNNEIVLTGNWLVTYWSDHAAREVRVLRIEKVDED